VGIQDIFDPKRDGWSFENFPTPELSWALYRRTYLAINPTENAVEAPLDVAYYNIIKNCAKAGNCGGMSVLALALFQYGGYLGFGSPAFFYEGGSNIRPPKRPSRDDLYEALNIMQARQFSAPGIRNFLDVVNAGQLNDAFAAFSRIQNGLANGDYHVLSLATDIGGGAAHTIIPYRADMVGGTRVLHVWDPNRPYDDYNRFYDEDHNKIIITGKQQWDYDQSGSGVVPGGNHYKGSGLGWFFSVPTSLIRHKARQPVSPSFALDNLSTLFVTKTGSVTQIEDDEGHRLFSDSDVQALETSDERLAGIAPWPWTGGLGGDRPGELYVLDRPPDSSPITITVTGRDYQIQRLSSNQLTEISSRGGSATADSIRIDERTEDHHFELRTDSSRRRFDVRHLRSSGVGNWRAVQVNNSLVTNDIVQVHIPPSMATVTVSGAKARRQVDIAFERCSSARVSTAMLDGQRLAADKALTVQPTEWTRVRPVRQRRPARP
jgi:hypothetical protein